MSYETILVSQAGRVGTITLNRPQALNALNSQVMREVTSAAAEFDDDAGIGAIIITGAGEKAFAAGADIKEMASLSFSEVFESDFFAAWGKLAAVRTPLVAAVAGYALGGGCELAMMADFIIASDKAKFGQPEIKLGVAPGMGGSQRLTRAIGKSKSMEMCLTGWMMNAEEAERSNLVARVVPHEELIAETLKTAATIAAMPPMATIANKEMVNSAFEMTLDQGLIVERRIFQILTASEDKAEGMAAFIEKREGQWKGR